MEFNEKQFDEFLYNTPGNLPKTMLKMIKQEPKIINPLVKIALSDNNPSAWRAAWLLRHVAKENPKIVIPFTNDIIKHIPIRLNHSQQGCLLGVITILKPDADDVAELIDLCIQIITNDMMPTYRIGAACDILVHVAKAYPELKREFADILVVSAPNFSNKNMERGIDRWLKQLK